MTSSPVNTQFSGWFGKNKKEKPLKPHLIPLDTVELTTPTEKNGRKYLYLAGFPVDVTDLDASFMPYVQKAIQNIAEQAYYIEVLSETPPDQIIRLVSEGTRFEAGVMTVENEDESHLIAVLQDDINVGKASLMIKNVLQYFRKLETERWLEEQRKKR